MSKLAEQSWRERNLEQVRELENFGCDTVLFGDSIMEGWAARPVWAPPTEGGTRWLHGDNRTSLSPPGLMEKTFGNGSRVFAIGGDRIQDLGWRISEGGGARALAKCQPRVAVLMLGTNNVCQKETVSEAASAMQALLKVLREALPRQTRLVMHALTPQQDPFSGVVDWGSGNSAWVMANALAGVMKSNKWNSTSFLSCTGSLLEGGRVPRKFFSDYRHPTFAGYEAWSTCLRQHLASF